MNSSFAISRGGRALLTAAFFVSTMVFAFADTDALAGKYSGTYNASANNGTSVSGAGKAVFKAKSGGEAALLKLSGTAPDGTDFNAKLVFNADGTCTTTALVPGVIEVAGTGTWKSNSKGTKITYDLSGVVLITTVSTKGTIKKAGSKLKISGKATASPPVPGLPTAANYSFTGM